MNAVDVMDQYRGYCPTKRKDVRLSTALFGFVVDCCVHNAYGIYNQLHRSSSTNEWLKRDMPRLRYQEFKRLICTQLVQEAQRERARAKRTSLDSSLPQSSDARHTLWPTGHSESSKRNMRVQCFLCSLLSEEKDPRCTFICRECNKGYHPECFNLRHNPSCVKDTRKELYERVLELKSKQQERHAAQGVDTATKKSLPLLTEVQFPWEKTKKKRKHTIIETEL